MKERNFSTVRKCTKGVKVVDEHLLPEHQLTRLAERELMNLQGRVSDGLCSVLMYHVRGFDEEMQLVMAENLVDFAKVPSADFILDMGYKMIAMEHGIMKKNVVSRIKANTNRTN